MILANVFSQLATQLATISGLQTYAYPPDAITPPAALMWPDAVTYDATYGRGLDQLSVRLWLVVGRTDVASAWSALSTYTSGSGTSAIKAVLESGTYTAFEAIRVMDATFGEISVGDVTYLAALFTLDIAGQGATP